MGALSSVKLMASCVGPLVLVACSALYSHFHVCAGKLLIILPSLAPCTYSISQIRIPARYINGSTRFGQVSGFLCGSSRACSMFRVVHLADFRHALKLSCPFGCLDLYLGTVYCSHLPTSTSNQLMIE